MSNRTLCNICRRWVCICPKTPAEDNLLDEIVGLKRKVAGLEREIEALWKWAKDEH